MTGVDPTGGDNRDPNPDGTGSYLELGGVRASVRPAGSRQCPGAVLPPAVDQEHRPVDVQELRGGRRQAGADSLGDLQPVQHGELVGIDTSAQFNEAGQQVDTQFGKATSARDPRIMQGAIRFTF